MRKGIATALIAVLALGAIGSQAQPTEASWTDASFGKGGFTTKTIPAPEILTCVASSTLGANPKIVITWKYAAASGYTGTGNATFYRASGGLLPNLTETLLGADLTTTGPVSGVYTTTYASALLSGLIGGTYLVGIRAKEDSWGATNPWTSQLASATATIAALGLSHSCDINTLIP